ncbi:MAG: gamma-glutamylcyclotransferase family protein [Fibrobacteria bacterium]
MEASLYPSDPDSGSLLFAYGTLMLATGIPAVDAAMRDAGKSLGRGWINGLLFDLGDYPGAVPGTVAGGGTGDVGREPELRTKPVVVEEAAPKVWGHLLLLNNPAALFSVIDPYEGFDASDPGGSEFVRSETRVFLPALDRWFSSQVFWYNFAIDRKARIGSGDYLAHWSAKGKPSQGRVTG